MDHYYKVIFDNGGQVTVFAPDEKSAMQKAEDKAQEHGCNLKARQCTKIKR